jgi:SAM-dependent methyltransferase
MSKKKPDLLWANISELPYFRGLLRAVEGRFYQDLPLPAPTLDLGCGDGQFAQITFPRPLELGVDPWLSPLQEARQRNSYLQLVRAYGQSLPLPDHSYASAVSNSVLPHVHDVQPVLNDIARILQPGGTFYFCVPNHNFDPNLSIARFFDRLGWARLAGRYRAWFDKIARHVHLDDPATWQNRIEQAGLKVVQHWNYFSPQALAVMEWGHYFGVPSW